MGSFKTTWRSKKRQIMIAWLAAWPTLTVVLAVLQSIAGDWPLPLRSLASATSMVLLMNFLSVPTVTALVTRLRGAQAGVAAPQSGSGGDC